MAKQVASEIHETVRKRYALAAKSAACCGSECCGPDLLREDEKAVFGNVLYEESGEASILAEASNASLGCGNPTAMVELNDGDVVLDLGSGGGLDVLLSARRVAPSGKAHGLDMTAEMLELAAENQAKAQITNVEWLKGTIEDIPLPDNSIDVVISNCVINLSPEKHRVFKEASRVLKPGGRFAVSDVLADNDLDEDTRADMEAWTGCIAGALTKEEFYSGLQAAGFSEIEIKETHRVHDKASAAAIRAKNS